MVYAPSETELLEVGNQLPKDRVMGCWYQLPSGAIKVLSVEADGTAWSTKFVFSDDALIRSSRPDELVIRMR